MKFNDITGSYTIKIFRIATSENIKDREKRKQIKELLLEYAKEKTALRDVRISKYKKDSENLRLIKQLLNE